MRQIDADHFEARLTATVRALKLSATQDLTVLWATVLTVLSTEPAPQECLWPEGVTAEKS